MLELCFTQVAVRIGEVGQSKAEVQEQLHADCQAGGAVQPGDQHD